LPGRPGPDRDAAFVQDIIDSCRAIETYTGDKTLTDFKTDAMLQDAVARRLFVTGEAVKNLSDECKLRHSTIDWKNIARLRDKFGHRYWAIEVEQVWEIVVNHVPQLRATLERDPVLMA
jgi:uncharacterized protein with HEPN domain